MRWSHAVLAALVALALGPASSASAGLVARYSLDSLSADGSVADSSGNNLHGTARAGVPIATGRFAGALDLSVTGDGFNATNNPLLEPRRLTVAAWVRKGGPFHVFRTIVGKGGVGCSSSTWALYTPVNGGLSFYVNGRDANGQAAPLQTPPIPPEQIWNGQWHAVAGTFDGTEVALWVDGVKVASEAFPGRPVYELHYAMQAVEKRLQIGRYDEAGCSAAGFQFLGDVDEVRLYDRVLTSAELTSLQDPAATEPPVVPDLPDTLFDTGPAEFATTPVSTFGFHSTLDWSTFQCKVDDAAFGPCSASLSHTTAALADGPHSFSVVASAGVFADPTPAVLSFLVDTTRPASSITLPPLPDGQTIYYGPVTVKIAASDAGSGVESTHCALNPVLDRYSPPPTYDAMPFCPFHGAGATVVDTGGHTLYFATKDNAGNVEATRSASFEIGVPYFPTTPRAGAAPDTLLTGAPTATAYDAKASFSFSADKPNATFSCRIDQGLVYPCKSPYTTPALPLGTHIFRVRATAGGLTDETPALYSWSIAQPPVGQVLARGRCTATPGGSGVFAFGASVYPRPQPADLTTPGRDIPVNRWWCYAESGVCPVDVLCTAKGTVTTTDRLGYWAFRAPLYGSLGSCTTNPNVGYQTACWDDLNCYADKPGVCRTAGSLLDVVQWFAKREPDGSIPFWARCSLGQISDVDGGSRLSERELPRDGSATCTVVFAGSRKELGIAATAFVTPSRIASMIGVLAPSRGTVSATAEIRRSAVFRASSTKKSPQKPAIAPVRIKVARAGTVYAPLKLNAAAQKLMRARKALTLSISVRFQPANGGPAKQRVEVKTLYAMKVTNTKRCPKSARTRKARAKCVALPAVPKKARRS